LFFKIEWVNLTVVARASIRFEVDGVIPLATRGESLGGFFFEDGSVLVVDWWYHFLEGLFLPAGIFGGGQGGRKGSSSEEIASIDGLKGDGIIFFKYGNIRFVKTDGSLPVGAGVTSLSG
jgi:hypothetical protein